MDEHIAKKPKLELSDASEPLTQRDVIAFQKEALFRCLNQWRSKANCLTEENEVLQRKIEEAMESAAGCGSTLVAVAQALLDSCKDDEDRQLLQRIISESEGDSRAFVHTAAENSSRICQLILKSAGGSGGTTSGAASERLQELEKLKLKLQGLLSASESKLKKTTEYYEVLLSKYDRQDSETVSRVFNSADDDNGSVKKEKNQSENAAGSSGGADQKKGSAANEEQRTVSEVEHEMQINDLKSQIAVLEATVKDLKEWKEQNLKELSQLRQSAAALRPDSAQSNAQDAASANAAAATAASGGNEKISSLMKQNEELQRINEAYMTKFQQLSSDREIFTNKLTSEFHAAQDALKKHNASLEKDLVRIRTIRDELLAKVSLLEAQKGKSEMIDDLEKLLKIQEEQLTRVESRSNESTSQDALMKELQDLEKAFKEVSRISNKKYATYLNQESVLSKLTVEKTKASEKYFAAMRSKDAIMIENKNLSKNLNKSNELIVQLKELEKTLQQKIESLHKQLNVSQENEKRLKDSNKETSMKIAELTSDNNKLKKSAERLESENKQLIGAKTELESVVKDKDIENKQLRIKVSNAEAKSKKLYKTLLSNGGDSGALAEELENFRTIIYCSLCSKNWKNTSLKTCGHVFCESCCKERLAARMRKCPTCNKPFSSNDLLTIHL